MAFRKSLKRHTSKFRHVFGTQYKKDECYEGLNLKPSAWDSCNNIKVSRNFFAVPYAGGGGAIAILPLAQTGKLDGSQVKSLTGHKSSVLDWDWNPFDDNIIASGSEDTTVKIFTVPEGGLTENMSEATATFSGHSRKVGTINWNPTASNILASSSIEKTCKIWDVEAEQEACQIDDMGDFITSLSWNYDGSQAAYVCKDKTLRIGDPRTGKSEVSVASHNGNKGQRCVWIGPQDKVFTFGFSKRSDRQFSLWDPKKMDEPIVMTDLDVASGSMIPLYDEDLNIMYVAGKGDGFIRYYEIIDKDPFIFPLNEFQSNVPNSGLGMLPKDACNVMKTEVTRMYKVCKTGVYPISFVVPRKGDNFQEDVFPPTRNGKASLDSSAWVAGDAAPPGKKSMKPGEGDITEGESTPKPKSKIQVLSERVAELEAENKALKEKVAALEAGGSTTTTTTETTTETTKDDDDDDDAAE